MVSAALGAWDHFLRAHRSPNPLPLTTLRRFSCLAHSFWVRVGWHLAKCSSRRRHTRLSTIALWAPSLLTMKQEPSSS